MDTLDNTQNLTTPVAGKDKQGSMDSGVVKETTTGTSQSSSKLHTPNLASKSLTIQQRVLVVSLCIQTFTAYINSSLSSPFYPGMAKKKGASVTQINLVFSIKKILAILFITSPFFARYLTAIGLKFTYFGGIYVKLISDMGFGLLDHLPDGAVFITISFICRIISALGSTASLTTSYAIIFIEFPDNTSLIFGLLQTMTACGLMVGPPVGGILYDLGAGTSIGSYTFTYLICTLLGIIVASVNLLFFPLKPNSSIKKETNDKAELKWKDTCSLLLNPRMFIYMIAESMAYLPVMFTEISLQQHLSQFHLSTALVGLMFSSMTAASAIFAAVWGWIDNYWFYPEAQTVLGTMISAVTCFLIGPSPLFGIKSELWLVGVSLSLFGFCFSAMNTASFKACYTEAINMGMPNDIHTTVMVSGLFVAFNKFGSFLGPTLGGIIIDACKENGFAWAMTFYGFAELTYTIIFILVIIVFKRQLSPIEKTLINSQFFV